MDFDISFIYNNLSLPAAGRLYEDVINIGYFLTS